MTRRMVKTDFGLVLVCLLLEVDDGAPAKIIITIHNLSTVRWIYKTWTELLLIIVLHS